MKGLIFLGIFLLSTHSFANYYCSGLVEIVGVAKDTHLYVDNGYGVHKICSVANDDHCNSWLSMALSAQAQKREFSVSHTHATETSSSACSSIGSWVASEFGAYYAHIPK